MGVNFAIKKYLILKFLRQSEIFFKTSRIEEMQTFFHLHKIEVSHNFLKTHQFT